MHITRWVVGVVLLALAAAGCGESTRNQECGKFSDWSNGLGAQVEKRAPGGPTKELPGGGIEIAGPFNDNTTNAERAAWFTKRARAIREVAALETPFTDATVKALAKRRTDAMVKQADALDAEATAWAASDREGVNAAMRREIEAQALGSAILDDWMHNCRE